MNYSNKVVFFTGAGISKSAGIPTFDEQEGLRAKLSRDFCIKHTQEYRETIAKMKAACDAAEPTAAHYALAELGYPVITMNIDGLHQKAGTKRLYAIHGSLPTDEELAADTLSQLFNKPVLYGDPAPLYDKARRLVLSIDENGFFITIGTSFYTGISGELWNLAQERGVKLININRDADIEVPRLCAKIERLWGKRDNCD